MGLTKRRLYKPERAPARKKGVLFDQAPIGCLDAAPEEIASAIFVLCQHSSVIIGRGLGYDSLRDEYTVLGKHLDGGFRDGAPTGKVGDFVVKGAEVADLIWATRVLNRGKFDKKALTKTVA